MDPASSAPAAPSAFRGVTDVFFDLDGTLVNTIPLILACYRHTLAGHLPGFDPPREVIIGNLGRSLHAILRDYAVAGGAADPDATTEAMAATYREFQRENIDALIQPYLGIREMLATLRDRGYRLGLVTSKVEWAARLTYERYGLGDLLDTLVFHDDTERHKPHPEPLLAAVSKAGISPGQAVYIGDSVHDMMAALAAGMRAIGALWGPFEPAALQQAGADALADEPARLLEFLPGASAEAAPPIDAARVVGPLPALSREEVRRYSRHLLLPEIGIEGQRRLKAASVLCIGTGGLGSPAALYLAAAGVGTIGLVDDDLVDLSNLQRQVVHGTSALGEPKVLSAARRLADLNPEIRIVPHQARLTRENARDLLAGYQLAVDCTDNFATRYLVNDACVLGHRPYVYGSVFRFEGQASVFAAAGGPCYRCLFPEPPPAGLVPSCSEGGVLGVLPGIIGSIQANEAIKLLLGVGDPLVGRLLILDALELHFREVRLPRDPDCPACGAHPTVTDLLDYEELCGSGAEARGHADRDIGPVELKRRLDERQPMILLDVREPMEHRIVNLPGSLLIPLGQLAERAGQLDPSATYVVYCHHGVRSVGAVEFLRGLGLTAWNLAGGVAAWTDQVDPALPRY
jgi:adenylyltransferase/sulfurtransferase